MQQLHAASFVESFVGFLGAKVEADAEYRKAIGSTDAFTALPTGANWAGDSAST